MVSLQPCQITKPADCQALVDLAVHTFGRIDVLFNNAAMAYFNWLEDITDEEWNRDLREEVDLVFFLTRAAWPHLKASHGVRREHGVPERPHELQDAWLAGAHDRQGRNHRHDAPVGDGRAGTRYSRELYLPWLDRDQSDARTAEGPGMGERDARQDAARTSRPAGGGRKRGAVPGL